jgi:hypothetical protein
MKNKIFDYNLNEFIRGYNINKKVCQNLINYFEKNKNLHKNGVTSNGEHPSIKKSTDIIIHDDSHVEVKKYLKELNNFMVKYIKLFPALYSSLDKWGITEQINIQKYKPNEGYFRHHCERAGKNSDRLLVFMTYLNDVKDGGETEFFHQKLKIKPEQGLTLVWPAEWTHTHRGITSKTETKYIITGWFSFI